MALTYFPVTGVFKAIISDTSDTLGAPDTQNISSFVYFTPSVDQVYSSTDNTVYRLQQIRARTNIDDGVLKNIDGTPVSLVANTAELDVEELIYTVSFDHVVYDQGDRQITGFRFVAPTDTAAVNLATVERLP